MFEFELKHPLQSFHTSFNWVFSFSFFFALFCPTALFQYNGFSDIHVFLLRVFTNKALQKLTKTFNGCINNRTQQQNKWLNNLKIYYFPSTANIQILDAQECIVTEYNHEMKSVLFHFTRRSWVKWNSQVPPTDYILQHYTNDTHSTFVQK